MIELRKSIMSRHSDLHKSLLLLPLPSPSAGTRAWHDVLSPTLSFVIEDNFQTSSQSSKPCILVIAAIPTVRSDKDTYNYKKIQAEVAGIYKSSGLVSIHKDISLQAPHGVDIRVLSLCSTVEEVTRDQGPAVSLFSLAQSHQKWSKVYAANDDTGHQLTGLLKSWIAAASGQESYLQMQYVPVPSPVDVPIQSSVEKPQSAIQKDDAPHSHQHAVVAVGGTFDHLHIGHKLLLTMTASLLKNSESQSDQSWRRLIVGITGDELLTKKKYAEYLESWEDRQYSVFQFLQGIIDFRESTDGPQTQSRDVSGPDGKAIHYLVGNRLLIECVEIKDPFGPTVSDRDVSALVLSGETRDGGKAINDKRREQGWPELEVFEVDVLDSDLPITGGNQDHVQQNFEGKISSTELRRQESVLVAEKLENK